MPLQSRNWRIIDPYGGLKDIENRVLRHISPLFKMIHWESTGARFTLILINSF